MNDQNLVQKETISILGCGWYGFALAKTLIEKGYRVKGSTTTEAKVETLRNEGIEAYLINLANDEIDSDFFSCDVLIISLPPKSSNNYIAQLKIVAALAEKQQVDQIIFISSTGVFEDGNFIVNELSAPKPITENGKNLLAAETLLTENTSFTTTILRFGGLIGPGRNLAKHFAGKKEIANGLAPINLIHLSDCIGITIAMIEQKAFGHIFHGVAPEHPTRKAFYTQLCSLSGFEKPDFLDELLSWKKIESVNVPKILKYRYYQLANWLM